MDIILAPDVYVNASVALGSPPEQVVQRVLGKHKGESKTTEWILSRVRQMLRAIPAFKGDAVDAQLDVIKSFVQLVKTESEFGADHWEEALVAAAKAAGATRVVTDHPDLLQVDSSDGVEFMSTEAWMIEATTPPPAPPGKK